MGIQTKQGRILYLVIAFVFFLVVVACFAPSGAQAPPDPNEYYAEYSDNRIVLIKRAFIGDHSYLIAKLGGESISMVHDEGCSNPNHQKGK